MKQQTVLSPAMMKSGQEEMNSLPCDGIILSQLGTLQESFFQDVVGVDLF